MKGMKMIAATSSKDDRVLETLKLVLMMASKQEAYSQRLKEYFFNTFTNARDLLDDPTSFHSDIKPDVISLAVRLKANEELLDVLTKMLEQQEILEDPAAKALTQLENTFDTNREPAHFSKEIYASI